MIRFVTQRFAERRAHRAAAGKRSSYATGGPVRRSFRRGAAVALALVPAACAGFQLYTPEEDMQLGLQAYDQLLEEEPLVESGPRLEMVRRVTDRLVEAAIARGPAFAADFEWEVHLIDDPETVNAFCLPGGKMAVYTGILPVTQDETGLAVVMGHEIAHATERHGTERMSRAQLEAILVEAGVTAAGGDEAHAQAAHTALEVAVNLPYSRSDELEADRVGLIYMAAAGYDPREADDFWERMAALSGGGGGGIGAFLSTHPTNEARIAQIRELLPEAIGIYESARGTENP